MKAKTLLLLALLAPLFTLSALADDPVEVGGIMYHLSSYGTATVTRNEKELPPEYEEQMIGEIINDYSGAITIPSLITVNGKTYSVVGVEDYAFKESKVTSVIISNIRMIGEEAFWGCEDLSSITILKINLFPTDESIKSRAFSYCPNLEEFRIGHTFSDQEFGTWDEDEGTFIPKETALGVSSDVFEGTNVENTTLFVPSEFINYYSNHAVWRQFGTIIGVAPKYYKLHVNVNERGAVVYGKGVNAITVTNSQTFDVKECERIVLTFTPNSGYKLGTVTVNDVDMTAALIDGVLKITDVNSEHRVNVEYVIDENWIFENPVCFNGIYYNLVPKGKIATVTRNIRQKPNDDYNFINNYSGPISIPSTITVSGTAYSIVGIEDYAFGCTETEETGSKITSVVIPESVSTIGQSAFMSCESLASVILPNSVTSIPQDCFAGCRNLTSISIPNSVTSIGNGAFSYCGLTSIPQLPVTINSIPSGCFSHCYSLTSVTIPETVTSIGQGAFIGCTSLTSVSIPNSVTSIYGGAFRGCSSLTSVTIPNSVTSIDEYAFGGCSSLTSVTIPESVTGIGKSAFEGCINLTSIDMPESVSHIADRAFYGCSNLTSVNFPELVEFINSQTFYGCSSLTSIIIPYVRNIEEQAFYGCTSLRSVILENVDFHMYGWMELIWGEAFANCINLEEFTIGSLQFNYDSGSGDCAVPAVSSVFENSFVEYATLHVPESAIGLYKAHPTWGQFGKVTSLGSASQYYKLFVDVNNKGKVVYGEGEFAKTISGASQTFEVKEQEDIVLTLTPNEGYKLGTVTVNGVDKTAAVVDGVLTITDVNANQNVSVEFVMDGTSVAVTIGELGVATFCCEEALDFSGTEDVKAYIVSAFRPSTGNVTLTRITDVPAGTGIVLLGNAGTYDIPLGAGETIVSNLLVGVTSPKTLNKVEGANTNFILADGENGIGFYTVVDGSTLAAGKAYLPLPTAALPSNAQSIGLRFDGTTGIRSMENGQWTMDNEEWFTIDGRRLDAEPTAKGLYIVNGRKVIVK